MLASALRVSVWTAFLAAAALAACASDSGGSAGGGDSGASRGSGFESGTGAEADTDADTDADAETDSSRGGGSSDGDGGGPFHGGNPNGSCRAGVPTGGQPADTSHPTTIVGSGTGASCTFAALQAAIAKGGVITFDCGSSPVTIAVTATLSLPTTTSTVVDGGNLVTLDGGDAVQILRFDSPGWQTNTHGVTLQHLALVHAKTTPTQAIPPAPAPCSQGWDDGEGGAVYMRDGSLTVVDCIFDHDQAAPLGPDTGGGAIYVQGSKSGVLIVKSTFTNDEASNGAAVGVLWAELDVYDSLFVGNTATGHDANNNDPSKCSSMNNGQNEIGSGGNGGALYGDGNDFNVVLCGNVVENNAAGMNAFGGGLFFTSDNMAGTLTIADTTMTGNIGGHWTNVSTGSVTNAGTAIGVNAKSITITNSTLQGVP